MVLRDFEISSFAIAVPSWCSVRKVCMDSIFVAMFRVITGRLLKVEISVMMVEVCLQVI